VTCRANIFSVDVEDYFHASALSAGVRSRGLENLEHRVLNNTHRILQILSDRSVHGTFFVLGWVAERYANLVREIQSEGHEIACHGYSHSVIYKQTPELFRDETQRARKLLEDITGAPVVGYRAASFSITKDTLWALDVLAETGFLYDSSIFPVHHDRYGIPDAQLEPHVLHLPNGGSLVEVPMTVTKLGSLSIPVSGGGYFRLYPYWLSRKAARKVNAAGRPWVFYVHPWEVDPGQPRLDVSWFSRFRHYNNLHKTESRLRRLLADFRFESMQSYLTREGMLPSAILRKSACAE
jgi:polysaccharide deacetylase family protein (PEP-CTERM system associated)